ncbi:CotH kinase family protein [Furfurilactobacillus siliginis]|uniref:Spore coat protein CotH n=1 Tax=Furfurilactobacillus siliginis TaxID=348151 RepID=A0A0R2L307_9LACO|nr:CotH kinase family protein [Furfurilactobacillus siliginis]KRN93868.1 hypothetical protein IV55_GL000670 [Furfurilactobacillus siliginis]GEK29050.1 hypothetical protein LSI01_13610 [Furfurilactobacillus siliginis]
MKKWRNPWGLSVVIGLIVILLGVSFTWLHFNTTRQLPLLSSQKVTYLPKVHITGAISQTKDKPQVVKFSFKNKQTGKTETGYAKMKWQGQSSRRYAQKNWNMKFYKDKDLKHKLKWRADPSWQKHSKYVLKANYIDATQSRNLVNANLWGQMVGSRKDAPKQLGKAQNGGAVNGFPIKLKVNGKSWGMYTLNTVKEPKLWGMDKHNPKTVAIGSNHWSRPDMFQSTDVTYGPYGWTPDVPKTLTAAQKQDFERFDKFVVNSSNKAFKAHAAEHLDVNSVIDMYLFANLVHDQDGLGRNLELITYDGQHWSATMYDLDSTWGLYENGYKLYPSGKYVSTNYPNRGDLATAEGNKLLQQVVQAYPDRVEARWHQLRKTTLTPEKVDAQFTQYMNGIGEQNYQENIQLNTAIPSRKVTSLMQIRSSVKRQFKDCDALFNDYTTNVHKLKFNYVAPSPTKAELASMRSESKASSASRASARQQANKQSSSTSVSAGH